MSEFSTGEIKIEALVETKAPYLWYHEGVIVKNRLIIFGGETKNGYSNKIYSIRLPWRTENRRKGFSFLFENKK